MFSGKDVCINVLGRILFLLLYHVAPPHTSQQWKINPLCWIRYNNEMAFKRISTECKINLQGYTRTHTRFIGFDKNIQLDDDLQVHATTANHRSLVSTLNETQATLFIIPIYTAPYSLSNRLRCFKCIFYFSVWRHFKHNCCTCLIQYIVLKIILYFYYMDKWRFLFQISWRINRVNVFVFSTVPFLL